MKQQIIEKMKFLFFADNMKTKIVSFTNIVSLIFKTYHKNIFATRPKKQTMAVTACFSYIFHIVGEKRRHQL